MFWAPEGYTFWARDFTGIEAVLVGYFAHSPKYIRLAKLGVHDYFNAHMLYNQKKIKFEDIPDLKLTDADLKLGFGSLKKKFKQVRPLVELPGHGSQDVQGIPRDVPDHQGSHDGAAYVFRAIPRDQCVAR
jgi:hypothetical protein